MNLAQLRKFSEERPEKIHQSAPITEELIQISSSSVKYDETQISSFCRIGPTANHSRCFSTGWCKCPCHLDENYDYMMGYGMM